MIAAHAPINRLPWLVVAALGFSPLCSCGSENTAAPSTGVTSVKVAPGSVTFTALGRTLGFVAVASDASGKTVLGTTFSWTSSDTTVATIDSVTSDPKGPVAWVRSVRNGSARIDATTDGVVGTLNVTVRQAVATITLTPDTLTLSPGETARLIPYASDANGHEVADATYSWQSADTLVATVGGGLVTGVGHKLSTALISATSDGKTGTAQVALVVTFTALSAGGPHTCALTTTAAAYCWGGDGSGELGNGTSKPFGDPWPVAVKGAYEFSWVGTGLKLDDAADAHTCGLATGGVAYCWGLNDVGQLGAASSETCYTGYPCSSTPLKVSGGLVFTMLSTAAEHVCGVANGGSAYCWGNDSLGQIGDGTTTDRAMPVPVVGGLTVSSVSAGLRHTCALTPSGTAYCWGDDRSGELGDSTTTSTSTPVPVHGGLTFTSISAGADQTCAVATDGTAYCWGVNSDGELGAMTANFCPGVVFRVYCSTTPLAVSGGLTFISVSAGGSHTCGVATTHAAYCWGINGDGELGDGTTTPRTAPVPVAGGLSFISITAGLNHTCGMTTDGIAYCWGRDTEGQLGSEPPVFGYPLSDVPVRVLGQR